VLASVICVAVARQLALITLIDVNWLVPVILTVSLVGAYALQSSFYDAVVAVIFGFVGYLMIRFDYPRLPLVIALFLGEVVEINFRQSMMIANGDWTIFFTRGLSLTLFVLIVLSLSIPLLRHVRRMQRARAGARS
jgi:putative tricarboxylic transport membrane protein